MDSQSFSQGHPHSYRLRPQTVSLVQTFSRRFFKNHARLCKHILGIRGSEPTCLENTLGLIVMIRYHLTKISWILSNSAHLQARVVNIRLVGLKIAPSPDLIYHPLGTSAPGVDKSREIFMSKVLYRWRLSAFISILSCSLITIHLETVCCDNASARFLRTGSQLDSVIRWTQSARWRVFARALRHKWLSTCSISNLYNYSIIS